MTPEQKLTRLLIQASGDLQKIYDRLTDELTKITARHVNALAPEEFYSIAKVCTPAQRKKVQALLDEYARAVTALIRRGVTRAVALSDTYTAALFKGYVQFSETEEKAWRKATAEAFMESRMKRDGGLNLSDRVWNYTEQAKSEFEAAVSCVLADGIKKGIDAETLGRSVRRYLKAPDMMYRRYHLKRTMADGTRRDVVEWRRRVIDEQGKVRFVKEDLAKTGTGVYRSARRNGLRLVITETNMAYNYANCKRWSAEPFVLGIRIRLSGNHPVPDICDELAGDYPKTFMWRGWHPRCRCSQSPIMMDRDGEEWKRLRSLPKDEYAKYVSPNAVKGFPENFTKWAERNEKKLRKAMRESKMPYFVRDNVKAIGDCLKWDEVSYPVGSGSVTIPKYVNASDNDYKKLCDIAMHFARQGANVTLTPKMKRPPEFEYSKYYKSLIGTKYEGKCPDLNVDGLWYEHEGFLTANPKRALKNMLNDGLKQASHLILDRPNLTGHYILHNIIVRQKQGQDIQEVWLRTEDEISLIYKKRENYK